MNQALLTSASSYSLAFLLIIRTRASDHVFPSNKTAITLLTLHGSLCIFCAVLAGQPQDNWLDLQFTMIMDAHEYCINPIITITTGVAFALQASTTRVAHGPTVFNPSLLLLQAVMFLGLALSWPVRFQVPQNLRDSYRGNWFLLEEWYPLVGWACINNAVIAIGQGTVLYIAAINADNVVELIGERQPLLKT